MCDEPRHAALTHAPRKTFSRCHSANTTPRSQARKQHIRQAS
jgi:hypothetical protein